MGLEALNVPGLEDLHPHLWQKYKHHKLIIMGGGWCVWDDWYNLGRPEAIGQWQYMTVNDMTMYLPARIEHCYSNDHQNLANWGSARRPMLRKQYGGPRHTHTCQVGKPKQVVWPWRGTGTSSLNACYTGLALGYEEIILCGVPLDNGPHFFDPPWVETTFAHATQDRDGKGPRYWSYAAERVFDGRVKSMSGRTRGLLGGP